MFTLHIPVRILLFNELFVVICFLGNSFERNIKNKYRSLILRHTLFNCSPLKTENIRSSGCLSGCLSIASLDSRKRCTFTFQRRFSRFSSITKDDLGVCVCVLAFVGERVFRKIWQKSVTHGKNNNNNNVFRPTTHLMFGVRGL